MSTKTNGKTVRKTKVAEPVEVKQEIVEIEHETSFDLFIEHQKKAFNEAAKAFESLIPTAFREHGEAAFKEVVEGYRTLFNDVIDQIVETIEKAKIESGKSMDDLAETVEKAKLEPGQVSGAVKSAGKEIKAVVENIKEELTK